MFLGSNKKKHFSSNTNSSKKLSSNSHKQDRSSAFIAGLPCWHAFRCPLPEAHWKWMTSDRPQCSSTALTWISLSLFPSTFSESAEGHYFFYIKHMIIQLQICTIILSNSKDFRLNEQHTFCRIWLQESEIFLPGGHTVQSSRGQQ